MSYNFSRYTPYLSYIIGGPLASAGSSLIGWLYRLNGPQDSNDPVQFIDYRLRLDEQWRGAVLYLTSLAVKFGAQYLFKNRKIPQIYYESGQVISIPILGLTWELIERTEALKHIINITNIEFYPTQIGTYQDLVMDLTTALITLLFVPLTLYLIKKHKTTS